MKTRPIILISLASIVLLAGTFLLVRTKNKKEETAGITQFLKTFNEHITKRHKDSVLNCFDLSGKAPEITKLVDLLITTPGIDSNLKPLVEIKLNTNDALILPSEGALRIVKIPVTFVDGALIQQTSTLTLKIKENDLHQFKIIEVDARVFFSDWITYKNYVRSKTINEKDIYSPVTLKAFITANELKNKYDSVIWFSHINQKTYFYVIKGKWDVYEGALKDSAKLYKMGLVGPDQKEIIPAEYDLIHNIGGTFNNLVEVEKDHKKGFYDISGKIVVPVNYDNIFPVNEDGHIAALKSGSDFYWLKNDFSISEKTDLKINDILPKLKEAGSFTITNVNAENLTEFNSREKHGCIYLPPSYLVDLNLLPAIKFFKNPLRKNVEYDDVSTNYIVKSAEHTSSNDNWFESTFYNIRDYFLGGRSEFYDKKNVVIIDKKSNRVYAADIMTDYGEGEGNGEVEGKCNINNIKAINDTLFEVKADANLYVELYDSTKSVTEGTYYHYFIVKGNKLIELPNRRIFGFTKYIKMDESYLTGCYNLMMNMYSANNSTNKTINRITPEMLSYMKNEIYADYRYQFKDKRWKLVFANLTGDYGSDYPDKPSINANVDDSLTLIDKYNINFINQKLKSIKPVVIAAK